MKAVFVSLALAALVSAQTNITLIPSGISSGCSTFLATLNNDTTLSTCVAPLINATASFNPLSGANLTTSDINWSLATMCKTNTGCGDAVIRGWLSRFYTSCSAELTSTTTYNAQVRELYDILYVVNPLKGAVCSIDSANQAYCVNQVIGVGANSTGPSGKNATGTVVSGSASSTGSAASSASVVADLASGSASSSSSISSSASGSASASSVSASSASGSLSASSASASASATAATNVLLANFATSWSPVQFAADNLYIAYTSASALSRRMLELLPRQDSSSAQSTLATVITPNATTYRTTNLPFLFLQPTFNASKLCTPCTREIMVSYIKWETAVPYALGLAQSPILGGQIALWNAIDSTCGATYVSAINAQVGQFVGISNSSSSAMSVLAAPGGMGLGSAMFGAAVAGVLAYLV